MLDVTAALAASEKLLYSFGNTRLAAVEPFAGLLADNKGNLYGTTLGGGNNKRGMVYELAHSDNYTRWTEHVLWSFGGSGDGRIPSCTLIADAQGNFYGTTEDGGAFDHGTVFELSPPSGSSTQWSEQVLWSFGARPDGQAPEAGLAADAAGNLYGTTSFGGANAACPPDGDGSNTTCGTAFEVSPPSGQSTQWSEKVLWSFGASNDGHNPQDGLIIDANGNLYGVTVKGGTYCTSRNDTYNGCGTVYELRPPGGQATQWSEQLLWNFDGAIKDGDGWYPNGTLLPDASGNLYGETYNGGVWDGGMVYELSPPAGQGTQWTLQPVWNFSYPDGVGYGTDDGFSPVGGLIADAAGNLYGATEEGPFDIYHDFYGGTVFRLNAPGQSPPSSELVLEESFDTKWTEQVLWDFALSAGPQPDGFYPAAGLIADNLGHLYGTTPYGGTNATKGGTVYEITLP